MGGRAAGILLSQVPDPDQLVSLRTWLGRIAKFRTAAEPDIRDGWDLFVHWPVDLGDEPPDKVCLGNIQLFVLNHAAEYTGASCLTPNDWARLEKAIGWMPVAELSIDIFCNRPRDHKTLAWLCTQLADRLGGIVDLGGRLPIPGCDFTASGGAQGFDFRDYVRNRQGAYGRRPFGRFGVLTRLDSAAQFPHDQMKILQALSTTAQAFPKKRGPEPLTGKVR